MLSQSGREVSAYFLGTDDKAVEFTTWNSIDAHGGGHRPVLDTGTNSGSAYGKRLKPSPNNTHNGVVFGYTVGRHLFFAMGPGLKPKLVEAVALYSNKLSEASFNALERRTVHEGNPDARRRTARRHDAHRVGDTSIDANGDGSQIHTTRNRAHTRWLEVRTDDGHAFGIAAASGILIGFWLDPLPSVSGRQTALGRLDDPERPRPVAAEAAAAGRLGAETPGCSASRRSTVSSVEGSGRGPRHPATSTFRGPRLRVPASRRPGEPARVSV